MKISHALIKLFNCLIMISSIAYGQSFGIGINLADVMSPYDPDNIPTIMFPITIGSFARIEPELNLSRNSIKLEIDNVDGETTEYEQHFGLGFLKFLSYEEEENNFYIGVRLKYTMVGTNYEGAYDYDDEENTIFGIAPTIGGEGFINEKFSIGGEVIFAYFTREDEDVDDGSTVVYNFFGGITRAFLRFYF